MANKRHERFPSDNLQRETTALADGLRLTLFRFYLGILSGIGYGFDSLVAASTRSSHQLLRKHSCEVKNKIG
jgi:hypothetical protein